MFVNSLQFWCCLRVFFFLAHSHLFFRTKIQGERGVGGKISSVIRKISDFLFRDNDPVGQRVRTVEVLLIAQQQINS